MKILVVALSLVVMVYARPGTPSGSYLPGTDLQHGGGSFVSNGYDNFDGIGGGNFIGSNFANGFIGGHGIGGHGGGGGGLVHDTKQVHFYAAPEDHETSHLRIYVAPNSARNTKVIFVKAPSYGALRPEIIAPPSHLEDKTKVYVLVKKPENGGAITIPTSLASRPTKPEVFFINYKTEQEAQLALSEGLQEQSVGSSAPELGNAQSFVRTLKTDISSGISINGIGGHGIGGVTGHGIGGVTGGDFSGSNLIGGVSGGIISEGKHGPIGESGPYRR